MRCGAEALCGQSGRVWNYGLGVSSSNVSPAGNVSGWDRRQNRLRTIWRLGGKTGGVKPPTMVQVVDFRRRCSILFAIEQNCETQEEDMMAESNVGSISIKDMILAPAVITLAVTILRLTGELNGWSPVLFSPEAGGGAALVGITWLVPVFGVYFALKLARSGSAPVSSGRVLAHAAAGLAAAVAIILGGGYLVGENYPVAMLVPAAAGIAGMSIACRGWCALGRILFYYALAARIPVILITLPAVLGNWGTHYDAPPPGFPEMSAMGKFFWSGVVPQMTIWVAYTMVVGALFGGIALLVTGRRRSA